jgi:hypothetical protein
MMKEMRSLESLDTISKVVGFYQFEPGLHAPKPVDFTLPQKSDFFASVIFAPLSQFFARLEC